MFDGSCLFRAPYKCALRVINASAWVRIYSARGDLDMFDEMEQFKGFARDG